MVCCNMCVVLLSMKRDFVREMGKYGEVQRYVQQGKSSFRTLRIKERDQRGGSFIVQLGLLQIESSYVTRSELVEGKLSKLGKIFDKVSGLLFFGQKKKARDLKADGAAITAINHSCHSWLMTSFAWRTILGIKFMIWLKMVR